MRCDTSDVFIQREKLNAIKKMKYPNIFPRLNMFLYYHDKQQVQ